MSSTSAYRGATAALHILGPRERLVAGGLLHNSGSRCTTPCRRLLPTILIVHFEHLYIDRANRVRDRVLPFVVQVFSRSAVDAA